MDKLVINRQNFAQVRLHLRFAFRIRPKELQLLKALLVKMER